MRGPWRVHFTRIPEQNCAKREDVARSPAIATHTSRFHHADRRYGVKVTRKFILPVSALKEFSAGKRAVPPNSRSLTSRDWTRAVILLDLGSAFVQDSRRIRPCCIRVNDPIGFCAHDLTIALLLSEEQFRTRRSSRPSLNLLHRPPRFRHQERQYELYGI